MNFKTVIAAVAVTTGMAFAFTPAPAKAVDVSSVVELARVIVNVNDIVYRNGQPYYRYGNYGQYDRVYRERYNGGYRYYRNAPRGVAHGYYGTQPGHNKHNYRNYNRNSKARTKYVKDMRKANQKYHKDRQKAAKKYYKSRYKY